MLWSNQNNKINIEAPSSETVEYWFKQPKDIYMLNQWVRAFFNINKTKENV